MVDATFSDIPRQRRERTELPKPQVFAAPVLISDCVTPLCGETVLSLMMKRMMRDAPDDQ